MQSLPEWLTTLPYNASVLGSAVLLGVVSLLIWKMIPFAVHSTVALYNNRVYDTATDGTPQGWTFLSFLTEQVLRRTLQILTGASGLYILSKLWSDNFLIQLLVVEFDDSVPLLRRLLYTLLLIIAVLLAFRWVTQWVQHLDDETNQLTDHQEEILIRLLQITCLIAGFMIGLAVWRINIGGLLVGAGFLGIIFGLAARQTIGAIIAGFVLMFSRPFEIGDWVQIGETEGMVTDITIVNTRLRTFNNETLAIPNDRVNDQMVVNKTDRERLRLRINVGVDYSTDLETAEEVAVNAAKTVNGVVEAAAPHVVANSFNDSSINLEVRVWIAQPSKQREVQVTSDVIDAVHQAFKEHGITIPFPQRTVSNRTNPEARPEDTDDPKST